MGAIRMIFGWAIGLGLFAFGMLVVMPYIMDQRCKGRWAPQFEAQWVWETGCWVKVGNRFFREQYVSFGPGTKKQ